MKQIQIKVGCIDKALAILEELLLSLDIEVGGEMAIQLQDLYYYMMREITLANLGNDLKSFAMLPRCCANCGRAGL